MESKKLIAGLFWFLAASSAMADGWVLSGGYTYVSEDVGNIDNIVGDTDISLGAIAGGIGYRFNTGDAFSITPELRLGFGVGDDDVSVFRGIYGGTSTADIKLNRLAGVTIRGQHEVSDSIYVFAQPSYINVEVEASAGSVSASADDWVFGYGGVHESYYPR